MREDTTTMTRRYRVVSLVHGATEDWPLMARPLWAPPGPCAEEYLGRAHSEAREAGVDTCSGRVLTSNECPACAVQRGEAVMIAWDADLDDEIRAFHQRRVRIQLERAQASVSLDVAPEPLPGMMRYRLSADDLRNWRIDAGVGVCTDSREFGRDYRLVEMHTALVRMAQGKPLYEHDCDECVFLGAHAGPRDEQIADLYLCLKGEPTVIARYGPGSDYRSGLHFECAHPALGEAARRARERGLLPEGERTCACGDVH